MFLLKFLADVREGRTKIDFVGWRYRMGVLSTIMVIGALTAFFVKGPNWGIDFTGGTEIHLKFHRSIHAQLAQPVPEKRLQDAWIKVTGVEREALPARAVQQLGEEDAREYLIRIPEETDSGGDPETEMRAALGDVLGGNPDLNVRELAGIGDIRGALSALGLSSDAVQQVGTPEDGEYTVRIQDPTFGTEDLQAGLTKALTDTFGADWIEESVFDAQVGARFTVRYRGEGVSVAQIQKALSAFEGAQVADAPDDNTFYVRLPGLSTQIEEEIRTTLQGKDFSVEQVDSVGPKVGGELRRQGFLSLAATLALILVYVAFRFELAFAPGAVLALFHDVTVVVGIFVLMDREFNLPIIGALLTIIGYSLNDTIVIYDRIRENMKRYRRHDTTNLINASVNETLARTLRTSVTTALAMTAFLVLGGPVIETFALAILLGVFIGTYSTVFVASPTILVMQDLKPHLARMFAPLAARDEERTADDEEPTSAAARRRIERKDRLQRSREEPSTRLQAPSDDDEVEGGGAR